MVGWSGLKGTAVKSQREGSTLVQWEHGQKDMVAHKHSDMH